MKKTLFLALALGMVTTASAIICPDDEAKGLNLVVGTETFESNAAFGPTKSGGNVEGATGGNATHVGSYKGDATLNLGEGVTLSVPNGFFIGGRGYGISGDARQHAGNGVVHMAAGSNLVVGYTPNSGPYASAGAHHVDVGNSAIACTGELYVDGGTVTALQLVIGMNKGVGSVVVKDGAVNLQWEEGMTKPAKPFQAGLVMGGGDGCGDSFGSLILDHSTLTDTSETEAYLGYGGKAVVEVKNGSEWRAGNGIFLGDVFDGAYSSLASAEVRIDKNSVTSAPYIWCDANTTLVNEGALETELYAYNGASIDNSGTLKTDYIELGKDVTLITGLVSVTGCESAMQATHEMSAVYDTGLVAATEGGQTEIAFDAKAGENVTVGARVDSGNGSMQHVYAADLRAIDTTIREGLGLDAEAVGSVNLTVAHILGENITANVTTDEACHGGAVTVALDGSHLVVRVGEETGSVDKVGTLGSYDADVEETAASVRVNTAATGSTIAWEGCSMMTVAGETATLAAGNTVKVGREATEEQHAVDGTLTVVGGSTLDNQGTIDAKTVVEQGGTLKGSGSLGTTDVHGNLVVGNSPGAPTFAGDLTLYSGSETVFSIAGLDTPATATLNGWESGAYSQITITDGGSLTLENGACFTIEFGGAVLAEIGGCQDFSFDLTLVSAGEGAITLGDVALTLLLDNTDFMISPDALAGGEGWSVEFDRSNMTYSVQDNGSTLHLVGTARLIPEPATATLSLLALAALAARRRRK